jgi:hypothetical protein
MKVFVSWSGERSGAVAVLLKAWLQCVIQAVDPWVSSKDIDRGSLWFGEISQRLGETSVGIICLTQANKEKPWIMFEAGALAKGLSSSRVCTLLIDLEPKDISDPLAQFNHTVPNKTGMFDLVNTLNSASGEKLLDDQILVRVFETYWPQFETAFQEIIESTPATPPSPRASGEVLDEILEATRSMSARIRKIEEQSSRGNPDSWLSGAKSGKNTLRGLLDNAALKPASDVAMASEVKNELLRQFYSNPPEQAS